MRYIKTFEGFYFKWQNIVEKNGKLYINVYKLSKEMEESANKERETKKLVRGGYSIWEEDKKIVSDMEDEYRKLVRKFLKHKVISFEDSDSDSHFGICFNVSFESGPTGFEKDKYTFQFEYCSIKLENDEEYYNVDEEVIVHLDIDPEEYKKSDKFNI